MAKKLKKMRIDCVGLVDQGANQGSMIVLAKRLQKDDGEIDTEEINTPSSEGPCPTCGGDHPQEGHAAYMASKKAKEPATKSVAVGTATKEELVVTDKEKPVDKALTDPQIDPIRSDYEKVKDELAKSRDLLQKQLDEANAELVKNRDEVVKIHKARRREQFIKRVQELPHLPGAPADDFAEFLDDVEKAVGEKRFAKFNGLLESWNTVIEKSALFQEAGVAGGEFGFTGPEGQLNILARERMAKDTDLQKLPEKVAYAKAYDRVIQTPEGRAIYKRHLAERKA